MEENYQKVCLNTGDIINKGWELTKKHFPVFLLLIILKGIISELPGIPYLQTYMDYVMAYGNAVSSEQLMQMMISSGDYWQMVKWMYIFSVVVFFIGCYVDVVFYRMQCATAYEDKVSLTDGFKNAFHGYWLFLGTYLVYGIIIGLGTVCCILPGIYLAIRFMFVPYVSAHHPELTFSEVFSCSWKMTKGHFWKLFWLIIVGLGINLVGLVCCCVGVVVTLIITNLMFAHVYKQLFPATPTTEAEVIEEMIER